MRAVEPMSGLLHQQWTLQQPQNSDSTSPIRLSVASPLRMLQQPQNSDSTSPIRLSVASPLRMLQQPQNSNSASPIHLSVASPLRMSQQPQNSNSASPIHLSVASPLRMSQQPQNSDSTSPIHLSVASPLRMLQQPQNSNSTSPIRLSVASPLSAPSNWDLWFSTLDEYENSFDKSKEKLQNRTTDPKISRLYSLRRKRIMKICGFAILLCLIISGTLLGALLGVLPVLYQPRLARRPVQPRVLRRPAQPRVLRRPAQPRVLRRPVQPRAPRPLPSRLVMTLARPVTYTATATQTTITFALRNDPDYWILDDVSIIQQGTTTELLSNGGFESAMTNWTYCYVT
ncbi:unnamed protein product, partial [Didymodactylos carnosus]